VLRRLLSLFPRVHWTTYERDGRRRVMLWRQWGRHVWAATEMTVEE
jgi:hypothetical protein